MPWRQLSIKRVKTKTEKKREEVTSLHGISDRKKSSVGILTFD